MKKLLQYGTLLLLTVVGLASCSVSKKLEKHPIAEVQFGKGGGFTGATTTYHLQKDGVITLNGESVAQLPADSVLALYQTAEQFTHEFVHPGNTYSFLRIIYQDGKTCYYCWNFSKMPESNILTYYQQLYKHL